MLEEFYVDNFLSWVNLTYRLTRANLLVGLNNTGKTNLCKALQFIAGTVRHPIDQCAELIGVPKLGLTNFSLRKDTIDFAVRATLPFEGESAKYEYILKLKAPPAKRPDETIKVDYEKLVVTCHGFEPVTLMENTADGVKLLHESLHFQGTSTKFVETTVPRETTMLHRLYDQEMSARATVFKRFLNSWQTYSLCQRALRSFKYVPNQFLLDSDGGNLASVVYQLKKSDERRYRKLLECIQQLEPDLEFINFVGGDNEPSISMRFSYRSRIDLPTWNASSGTLKFLGLAYALLVQPHLDFQPFVVIEEPENGLYVNLLKKVIDMAEDEKDFLQVLFTSHSPYFIDQFDDKLDSVFVARRDGFISKLSSIDAEKAKARLKDQSLGEQHFWELLA